VPTLHPFDINPALGYLHHVEVGYAISALDEYNVIFMVSTLKMEAAACSFEMLIAPAHFHSASIKKTGLTLTLDHHGSQNSITLSLFV
jgi:hypothetical protein